MKDYSRFNSTPLKGGLRHNHQHQQHTPLEVVTPASPALPQTDKEREESQQPLLTKSSASPSGGEESTSTCATTSSTAIMNESHGHPELETSQPQWLRQSTNDDSQPKQQPQSPPAAMVIDSNVNSSQQQKVRSPTSANNGTANNGTAATLVTTNNTSTSSPSPQLRNMLTTLTASDALSVRREGVEATISKLRTALEDASSRDSTSKAALAKSDAVILELRSSLRQLKRQLDKVQNEKTEAQSKLQQAHRDLTESQQKARQEMTSHSRQHQLELQQLQHQLVEMSNSHNKEERVGELQVQLDRAHAQILTADMVRKELEDTLEAEQYTWELRVQDQERTIQQLQHECNSLAEELNKFQTQFKDQENHWNQQIQELQQQLQQQEMTGGSSYHPSNRGEDVTALKEKIAELEQERSELQSCLDEALQELEAVDAEMQGNWQGEREQLLEENDRLQRQLAQSGADALEPLQHLYRWLLEREGVEDNVHHHQLPNDMRELMDRIKGHLDQLPSSNHDNSRGLQNENEANEQLEVAMDQVRDLEAQLSVYRGDLRAREESSAELRASLKEAVSLLKPLQDAVAKSEREKQELQQYIMHLKESPGDNDQQIKQVKDELTVKVKEVQRLQHQVHSLEVQLAETKEINAAKSVLNRLSPPPSPLVTTPPSSSTSRSIQAPNEEVYEKSRNDASPPLSKARQEVRAKRAAETALKQLLRDAQDRFSMLNRQNIEVEAQNRELQTRLHEAADMLAVKPAGEDAEIASPRHLARDVEDAKVKELQEKLQQMELSLQEKALQLASASEELERARSVAPVLVNDYRQMESELQELHTVKERLQQVEAELATTKKDLHAKRETERLLNKSLREALGLLKPLQLHLEDAEHEKRELIKELKAYRRSLMRLERGENDTSSYKSRSVGLPDEVNFEIVRAKEQLEATVRQLEQENSQLHDALEDLSHNLNVSGVSAASRKQEERLLEELVEINSRYEVTQSKLKDAHIENHALLDALKVRESEEQSLRAEMAQLKQKLKKSESELENAKQIATTALIKVEELTIHHHDVSKQSPEPIPLQIGGARRERRLQV
jgi:chromosome segregation ATPase